MTLPTVPDRDRTRTLEAGVDFMHDRARTIVASRVLLEGWRWMVALTLLGGVIAGGAGMFWPKAYTASAVLILESPTPDEISMETEQLIAASSEVRTLASEELGLPATEVKEAVTVTIPKGARALRFTATSHDPHEAARLADAVALAYRDHQVGLEDDASRASRIKVIKDRILELQGRLEDAAVDTPRAEVLETELGSAERELLDLELASDEPRAKGRLVSPALPPSSPSTPGLLVFAAGGMAAGLLGGAAVAVAAAQRPRHLARLRKVRPQRVAKQQPMKEC